MNQSAPIFSLIKSAQELFSICNIRLPKCCARITKHSLSFVANQIRNNCFSGNLASSRESRSSQSIPPLPPLPALRFFPLVSAASGTPLPFVARLVPSCSVRTQLDIQSLPWCAVDPQSRQGHQQCGVQCLGKFVDLVPSSFTRDHTFLISTHPFHWTYLR